MPTTPIDLDAAVELGLHGARRVAVVGASDRPSRPSHAGMRALLQAGYDVVPVNPGVDAVLGQRAYPDLASVPGRIDVVNVFRAAAHLPGVAAAAVGRDDVGVVWNQLGLVSPEARATVRGAGRGYVEDRCMRVEAQRAGARPPAGPRVDGEVLLVDLDGTVLDYVAAERRALRRTLAELGLAADGSAVADYRRINAAHWAAFERDELTAVELRTARWEVFVAERSIQRVDGEAAAHAYLERLAAAGDVLSAVPAALWWLGRRATLVAMTNGFDDVQRGRLAAAGLWDAFDGFVSSDGVGAAKPDPAIVDAALATVGVQDVDRDAVIVIGDSLSSDVAAGHAVGARTVWIAPEDAVVPAGAPAPDMRVERLVDVA